MVYYATVRNPHVSRLVPGANDMAVGPDQNEGTAEKNLKGC